MITGWCFFIQVSRNFWKSGESCQQAYESIELVNRNEYLISNRYLQQTQLKDNYFEDGRMD